MVDKEKLAATEARPNKPVAAVKLEEAQPKASGGSVHLEPTLPQEARKCFVTTTKGSKLLLFLKPTLDVKQILSETAKRHNAQCKELGRIKCKFLSYCEVADGDGFKLTNDMLLKDFAPAGPVHLTAEVEDAVVTKRKAVAEDGDKPAKKAKATPTTNGASGSGTGAAVSEGPKKRGRPSNKEKAEKEAAAAAVQAAADDKGKAPMQAQVPQAKPATAKKGSKAGTEITPAASKKSTKQTPKTPAVEIKKEESSSSEEESSSSGEEEAGEEESGSGSEESSSEEEEEKSPEPRQQPEPSDDDEESSSGDEEQE